MRENLAVSESTSDGKTSEEAIREELSHKRAWTTFAWLGALIALCDGLNRVGFVKWFADGIATHLRGFSPHLAMLILVTLFFVAHYLFASVDAYTTPSSGVIRQGSLATTR